MQYQEPPGREGALTVGSGEGRDREPRSAPRFLPALCSNLRFLLLLLSSLLLLPTLYPGLQRGSYKAWVCHQAGVSQLSVGTASTVALF